MIKDPACRDVRDANTTVAVPDAAQHRQELLEQLPVSPGLDDHVEVLQWPVHQLGVLARPQDEKDKKQRMLTLTFL